MPASTSSCGHDQCLYAVFQSRLFQTLLCFSSASHLLHTSLLNTSFLCAVHYCTSHQFLNKTAAHSYEESQSSHYIQVHTGTCRYRVSSALGPGQGCRQVSPLSGMVQQLEIFGNFYRPKASPCLASGTSVPYRTQ